MDFTLFVHIDGQPVRRAGFYSARDHGEVVRLARLEFIRAETTAVDVWEAGGELYRLRREDVDAQGPLPPGLLRLPPRRPALRVVK